MKKILSIITCLFICSRPLVLAEEATHDLSTLWTMYYETQDSACIKQILEVLNEDKEALILAYEWKNRREVARFIEENSNGSVVEFDDIWNYIERRAQEQADFPLVVASNMLVLDSIELHTEQDPILCSLVQELVTQYPELDCWNKISLMIQK